MHLLRDGVASLCGLLFNKSFETLGGIGDSVNKAVGANGEIASALGGKIPEWIKAFSDVFVSVGYAICVLFFLIALIELSMSERMTFEYFIKFLSKLIVGYVAVGMAPFLATSLYEFGTALATDIASVNLGEGALEQLEQVDFVALMQAYVAAGGERWFMLFIISVLMVVPILLLGIAITLVAYFIGFSRVVEILIRSVFLPVALALLSDDGWHGAGGRYVKRYVAVCAQGAVLVAIGVITSQIMGQIGNGIVSDMRPLLEVAVDGESADSLEWVWDIVKKFLIMAGLGVASVSAMFKSIGFINDAFGA